MNIYILWGYIYGDIMTFLVLSGKWSLHQLEGLKSHNFSIWEGQHSRHVTKIRGGIFEIFIWRGLVGTSKARKGGGSGYGNDNSKLKHPPPRAYPGHLMSSPSREGGNLMNLVFPGAGHLITTHSGWGIWSLVSITCYELHWFHVTW